MLSSGWGCLQVPAFPETGKRMTSTPGGTVIGKRETSISDSPVPFGFCHCLPPTPSPPLKPAYVSHLYRSVNVSPLPGNLNSGHRVRLGVRQTQHSARYKVHVGGNRQTSRHGGSSGTSSQNISAPVLCLPSLPCPRTGHPSCAVQSRPAQEPVRWPR